MAQKIDLLIIGAGLLGAAYARLVAERCPDTSIILVDLGPILTDPPGMNLLNLNPRDRVKLQTLSQGPVQGHISSLGPRGTGDVVTTLPGLHLAGVSEMSAAAMATCVGGMGSYWSCITPRPDGAEQIPFIDQSDWLGAIDEAESLLCVSRNVFEGFVDDSAIKKTLTRAFGFLPAEHQVQDLPMAAERRRDGSITWTGVDTLLGPIGSVLSDRGSLEIREKTLCRRLVVDQDRIVGAVLVNTLSGMEERVEAKSVVVAADSLRTPQLLYASGIRPPALGRYLNEHPVVGAAVRLYPELVSAHTFGADAQTISASRIPFSDRHHPFHGQIVEISGSTLSDYYSADPTCVALAWFGRKEPRPDDRIAFSSVGVDWCGMPAMHVFYSLSSSDVAERRLSLENMCRAAGALGDYVPGFEPKPLPDGSSLHYQGTVRMGARNDGTSVCDTRSRVWGYRNLFVAGNGVIPTMTACNPTLTSVTLAVHAMPALCAQLV